MKTFVRLLAMLFAAILFGVSGTASFATGNSLKQLLLDDEDPGVTVSGNGFSQVFWQNGTVASNLLGPPNGEGSRKATAVTAETAYVQYDFQPKFGSTLATGGTYNLSAYIPNDDGGNSTGVIYRLYSAPYSFTSPSCGGYTLESTYNFDQAANEGRWGNVGNFTLGDGLKCLRVQVTNQASAAGNVIWADALNVTRLFESSETIVDMPRTASAATSGNVFVNAAQNAATPTTLTTLTFTCPKTGNVLITGSGEATIVSGLAGTGFAGLYFSLVAGATQFDSSAAWQISSKFDFNGDAARQMVNAQKIFSCAAGTSVQYRLVATRRDNASTQSNVFNPTLTAIYTP